MLNLNNEEWKKPFRNFFENAYLMVLALFIIHEFLEYTMFPIDWNVPFGSLDVLNAVFLWLFDTPQCLLAALVIARIIFLKEYDWQYFLVSAGILFCVRYAWQNNNSVNILMFVLLVIGAKDIPFRRIVNVHLYVLSILLGITILASLTGVIENVYYDRGDGWERYAFGITYPTNFAAYIFYLILLCWYHRGEKWSYAEIACTGMAGVLLMIFCQARTSFLCLMLAVFMMILCKRKCKGSLLAAFLSMSVTLCAIFSMVITICYSPENAFLKRLNELFTNRLSLGKKGVNIYGFRLWGQAISMNGNGEGTVAAKYFFLDNSYMQFAIIYGIVILGLILAAFYAIGCQAKRNGEWELLWILALIGIHSMMEHHLLEISSCTFILAVFAEHGGRRWRGQLPEQEQG